MLFKGKTNEYLRIEEIDSSNCKLLQENKESSLRLLWFADDKTLLFVDNEKFQATKNQIVCLTEFHKIDVQSVGKLKLIHFNREFYCILDHDEEISCKGVLFFGASQLPVLQLVDNQAQKIDNLMRVFDDELESEDELQLEMLQMLLKRLLILCTRIYKNQNNYNALDKYSTDIVREYNFLVEQHFKTRHTVLEYAEMLNKSPKTISNIFSKLKTKTPLQFIQDRIMLEARRLLRYTDTPVKEIAYELGYEDLQTFSRFFKKNEGFSPSQYKKNSFRE